VAERDVLPSDLAIRTEALGKRFGPPERSVAPSRRLSFLGQHSRRLETIGSDLRDDDDEDEDDGVASDLLHVDNRSSVKTTWALRNVSIDASRGSGIALLGGSGSGKSTLLRVLARITPPTEGRALVRGRVIPLVEVANALLQPELTIRANIVGLAQLFGVPREVAQLRTREIVAFAGLGSDLGAAVNQLSSGLRRQLTVATALFLDADVLLVEDFVGRGDKKFGERALKRLVALKQEGVTLVVATHDIDLLRRLCDQAVHLEGGMVVDDGPVDDVIKRYDGRNASESDSSAAAASSAPIAIVSAVAWSDYGAVSEISPGEDVTVRIELDAAQPGTEFRLRVNLSLGAGSHLTAVQPTRFKAPRAGGLVVTIVLPGDEITGSPVVGSVRCDIGSAKQRTVATLRDAFTLDVRGLESAEMAAMETGDVPETASARRVTVELSDLEWRLELC
jgi:ABC-type polysaccharide/polyol phosphate transport system ATPase subunit